MPSIQLSLSSAKALLKGTSLIQKYILLKNESPMVLTLETAEEFKTNRQNRLFHKLLSLYWTSGCCSDASFESLRDRYKRNAGLISDDAHWRKCSCGKRVYWKNHFEKSWSNVSKKMARFTIDTLIAEMIEAQVLSSKNGNEFNKLLETIEG